MSGKIHGSGPPAKIKFSPRRAARVEPTRRGLATHAAEDRHSVAFGESCPIRREVEILPIGQDTSHIRLHKPPRQAGISGTGGITSCRGNGKKTEMTPIGAVLVETLATIGRC